MRARIASEKGAPAEAGPRLLIVTAPPLKTSGHSSRSRTVLISPTDSLVSLFFLLPALKMTNQLAKCKYPNIHSPRPAVATPVLETNPFQNAVTLRSLNQNRFLFQENKFDEQPQGQKHSPEEYKISNALR